MVVEAAADKTEEEKILKLIVTASEEFLQSAAGKLNYQKITDTILDISGAKYAGFELYDEDGSKYTTVALSAPEGIIKKTYSLLGFKLLGKKWEHDLVRAEKIKFSTITHFSSLLELTGDVISKPVISLLEKTLNLGEVFLIKILKENMMIGNFTLIMPKNVNLKNENYLEIYTRQLGLLITRKRAEEALRESETSFRSLIENMNEGVALHELMYDKTGKAIDYRIISINPAYEQQTGISLKRASNALATILYGVSPAPYLDKFEQVVRTGKPYFFETYFPPMEKHFRISVFSPKPGHFATVFFDITENKRAEETLRKSEQKFLKAFHSGTVLMAISRIEDGCFIDVNEALLKTLGYKREEVIGKTSTELDILDKDQRAAIKKVFDREGRVSDAEVLIKGRDGSVHTGIFTADPIDIESPPCWLITITDITDRKKTEEALRESEEKFRGMAELLPETIFETNMQGILTFVNQQAYKVFGYTRKDFVRGINALDMLIPSDWERAQKVTQTLFQGGKSGPNEYTALRKDGSTFPILISSSVINHQGEPIGTRGLIFDITERKKAEAEILHLSFHDYLTGLYNRRFFEEELKRLDKVRQLPLSFIMGDLNALKIVNDVFGHSEGDKLLKEAAEILKTVCRSDDILARWGGDEFVILLPKTSAADAEEIVARIKKECKKTENQKIPISLSLGVATKETADTAIESIVVDAESNMYKNKLAQKESLTSSIIFALDQALYEKSSEIKEHTARTHVLALNLGKAINLSSSQLDELSLLVSLHDIGKVAISEKILLKKDGLTEKEWDVIKRHPEIGFNIAQASPQISHIAKSILACHENWDGSGYPLRLKGKSIPVTSRIILIVDAYDIMTSANVYKKTISGSEAVGELKRYAGTQFDPVLVDKFIEILEN